MDGAIEFNNDLFCLTPRSGLLPSHTGQAASEVHLSACFSFNTMCGLDVSHTRSVLQNAALPSCVHTLLSRRLSDTSRCAWTGRSSVPLNSCLAFHVVRLLPLALSVAMEGGSSAARAP